MSRTDPREQRVLVLAPTGRDAPLIAGALGRHGFASAVCRDLGCVCREMAEGAGMAVLTEESLLPDGLSRLVEALRQQPPWSDFPLLILTGKGAPSPASVQRFQALEPIANVTQQERPVRIRTLVSAARAALRGRQCQYQVREYLAERENAIGGASLPRWSRKIGGNRSAARTSFSPRLLTSSRNPAGTGVQRLADSTAFAGDKPAQAAEQARSMMDRQVQQLVQVLWTTYWTFHGSPEAWLS